jgi:hypothetical protein
MEDQQGGGRQNLSGFDTRDQKKLNPSLPPYHNLFTRMQEDWDRFKYLSSLSDLDAKEYEKGTQLLLELNNAMQKESSFRPSRLKVTAKQDISDFVEMKMQPEESKNLQDTHIVSPLEQSRANEQHSIISKSKKSREIIVDVAENFQQREHQAPKEDKAEGETLISIIDEQKEAKITPSKHKISSTEKKENLQTPQKGSMMEDEAKPYTGPTSSRYITPPSAKVDKKEMLELEPHPLFPSLSEIERDDKFNQPKKKGKIKVTKAKHVSIANPLESNLSVAEQKKKRKNNNS